MKWAPLLLGGLGLVASAACSSVEPLTCGDDVYFHLDDGLPVCGLAPNPADETLELNDWPSLEPPTVTISNQPGQIRFGGDLEGGCPLTGDALHFAVESGSSPFVEAEVRLTPDSLQVKTVIWDSLGHGLAVFHEGPGEGSVRAPLLLFAASGRIRGPASVHVEHIEVIDEVGDTVCPSETAYQLELEVRGAPTIRDLGTIDGTETRLEVVSPQGVQLYSVTSAARAPLVAEFCLTFDISVCDPAAYLRVNADGTASYVDYWIWQDLPDTTRYFEVRPIDMVDYQLSVSLE